MDTQQEDIRFSPQKISLVLSQEYRNWRILVQWDGLHQPGLTLWVWHITLCDPEGNRHDFDSSAFGETQSLQAIDWAKHQVDALVVA